LAAADYAPLMERLKAIHASGTILNAVDWQEQLWRAHVTRDYGFARGVSAMPSMHNAIAFLYVLTVRNASLLTRTLAWAFAVAILIGSVHLGWHYLVDGLFAWAAMAAVWWAAGAFLKWVGYEQLVNKGEPQGAPDIEPAGVPAAA
jgi:membrane-associated phospholipid phosphatase